MKVRLSAKNLIDNSIANSIEFEIPHMTFDSFLLEEKELQIDLLDYHSQPIRKLHNIPHGFSEYYSWSIYEILDENNVVIYTRNYNI